jgi:circadian clock protein KaiC
MMFNLARQGRRCLYFTTLSEPAVKLLGYMQLFSFFDQRLLEKMVTFVDLGSVIRGEGGAAALTTIAKRVERDEPALVVVDSFKALRDSLGEPNMVRTFVYDLAVHTAGWGAASLLVGEYTDAEVANNAEFSIADGILRFTYRRQELAAQREVEVLKLRGSDFVTGRHFFEISTQGVTFYPRVGVPETTDAEVGAAGERVGTGVAGLDAILGGGLPRTSSTVVQGGTGTGKTMLGLHFLLEGARRAEPGILFTLEETAAQLRGIAGGFGWDLAELERQKLLTLAYVSPVELSTDAFLHRARQQAESLGARRAVLDSLTSLGLSVASERRFNELVYALTKHFRALGVTLSMNMETEELLGTAQISGHGVSYAADNVIQLRYVEVAGRLDRGIFVLKSRGVHHGTEVRRMTIGTTGVVVGPQFEGLRGVLTGLPVPVSASEFGRLGQG